MDFDEFAKELGKRFRKELDKVGARLDALEDRGLLYRGVFQRADTYRRGDSVTHRSSLWIALAATSSEPGSDGTWQLACKGAEQ